MKHQSDAPVIHFWTGDEDLPEISTAAVPEIALAGGSPMPPEVIRKRSKGIRTRKLEHPGWKIVRGDRAIVRGDISPDDLKATAVYTTELYVMLRSYLGGGDWDGLFSSRLFQEATAFRRAAIQMGASNAESYYDPRSAEIVMHFGLYPTSFLYQRAFAHEFAHAYIDQVLSRTSPLWFMEGLAEWFSNLEWRGDIFVPGQMNGQVLWFLGMGEHDLKLDLERLVTIGRDEMYGQNFASYYAQAWSVVDWLMTSGLQNVVREMLAGDFSFFLDPLSVQEEWRSHVRRLTGMWRS